MSERLTLYVQIARDKRTWYFTPRVVKATRSRPAEIHPESVLVKLRIDVPRGIFDRPEPVLEVAIAPEDVEHPALSLAVDRPDQ